MPPASESHGVNCAQSICTALSLWRAEETIERLKHRERLRIADRVVDPLSIAARAYEFLRSQHRQLLRQRGLLNPKLLLQLAHATLALRQVAQ